jgi:hypothetical protein
MTEFVELDAPKPKCGSKFQQAQQRSFSPAVCWSEIRSFFAPAAVLHSVSGLARKQRLELSDGIDLRQGELFLPIREIRSMLISEADLISPA